MKCLQIMDRFNNITCQHKSIIIESSIKTFEIHLHEDYVLIHE